MAPWRKAPLKAGINIRFPIKSFGNDIIFCEMFLITPRFISGLQQKTASTLVTLFWTKVRVSLGRLFLRLKSGVINLFQIKW